MAVASKDAGISEQSYYRWKKEYGGLKLNQAKKLEDLERENARLKKIIVACRWRVSATPVPCLHGTGVALTLSCPICTDGVAIAS